MASLVAITCDGCNVNTGKHAGVIKRIELELDRPLQWLVCLLHLIELPLREKFRKIDGVTSGPRTYQGEIGEKIQPDLRTLQIVKFEKIFGKVEEIQDQVLQNLSSDQKYLYEVALSVQTGNFPIRLATRSPGTLNEARWLTKAIRILRLYVSTNNPSFNLVKLVSFILNLYAPAWFKIKSNPRAVDGAKNFFTSYICYPSSRKMIRSFVNQLYFAMHTFHTVKVYC